MKEVEKTEDKLVFSDGDKTISFNRLEHGIAMEVLNITPEDVIMTVQNFVNYIAWEHHVDISNVQHEYGRFPRGPGGNWNNLL